MEDKKPMSLKKQLIGYAGRITMLSWAGTLGGWIGSRGVDPASGSPAARLAATGLPEVVQFIITATVMSIAMIAICALLVAAIMIFAILFLYILDKIENSRRK